MRKFRIAKISDDEKCSACGKILKRSYWLVPLDQDGNDLDEPSPYGRDCAAKMLGWSYDSKFNKVFDRKISEYVLERREQVFAQIRELKKDWFVFMGVFTTREILLKLQDNNIVFTSGAIAEELANTYDWYDFDEAFAKAGNDIDKKLSVCDEYERRIKNSQQ